MKELKVTVYSDRAKVKEFIGSGDLFWEIITEYIFDALFKGEHISMDCRENEI